MRVFNNTDDLDLTAYLPSQSGDSAIVRIIGVSNTACPTGYSPSFSLEIGNTENAPSLSSTIWPTTDIINAPCDGKVWGNLWSFYLWHTNRGTDEIKAEVPIDVSFRAGQQISYKGRRAQIKQVTHVLQAKTVTSSLTCDGVS